MTTIARPYATAAFEYALEKNTLSAWQGMLHSAVFLVEHSVVKSALSNPSISRIKMADLFCDILSASLDTDRQNFIRLLAERNRLAALPDIARLFANYCTEYEKNITVQVASAVELDEDYQHKLATSLTNYLKRQVSLQCKVDTVLLGGIVVRAGDRVIDGSVRGKLHRLYESLETL